VKLTCWKAESTTKRYDILEFMQTKTNLSEINTLKLKINRLNMTVFNFRMQQLDFY